ncbi:MAG: hypothetical protein WA463_19885 [Terriglobales bacterium]
MLVALLGLASATAIAQQGAGSRPSWKVTNDKAANAVSGEPTAVAALADDVLSGSVLLEPVSAANSSLRTDLIGAELDYRAGRHPGVRDERVATAINTLARKAGAPEFAQTDTAEVRRLRMGMMSTVPALFAHDLKREDSHGKAHIRDQMSPIEAVYLAARMVDQKIWNPNYQLTAEERRQKSNEAQLPLPAGPNPKTKELLDAVTATPSTTSSTDLATQASDIFSKLVSAQEGGD